MSVYQAAQAGRRSLLIALRDEIASQIDDGVPPRDLASLSRRLIEIDHEIDAVLAQEDGDDIGEAAATPDAPWPFAGRSAGSST